MTASRYGGPALLVPLAVEGLVYTANSVKGLWSWVPPKYTELGRFGDVDGAPFTRHAPVIGKEQFRGVLLRWALPDGLTHGQAGPSGEVQYPDVPNRWLVVRKFVAVDKPHAWSYRAFIVASDFRSDSGSPFIDDQGMPILIGRSWPIDQWPGEAYVQSHAATPLTAAGAGDATFAAYVPNVSTVFGFGDSLDDVLPGVVTYSVTGWYAGLACDPMLGVELFGVEGWRTGDEWSEVMGRRSWSVGDERDLKDAIAAGLQWAKKHDIPVDPDIPREILPSRTLCHGMLYEVGWQGPQGQHVSGVPTSDSRGAGYVRPQVAIGASSIDAMAALLAVSAARHGLDPDKISELENILQAFQADSVNLLDRRDAQAQLDLQIQSGWFATTPGGTVFEVVAPDVEQRPGDKPPPALTPQQRSLLTALNESQAQMDAAQADLASQQQSLFLLWWKKQRLGKLFPPPVEKDRWEALIDAAMPSAQAAIDGAGLCWLALRQRRDQAFVLLSQTLDQERLVASPVAAFSQANEPVLMVTGAHRAFVHGEDARFGTGDALFCRFTGQTVAGIRLEVEGIEVTVDTGQLQLPDFPGAELPAEAADLLAEQVFLDLSHAPTIAALANPADPWPLLGRIREEQTLIWNADLNAPLDRRTIAQRSGLRMMFDLGALPSKLAVTAWSPPWTPLLIDWRLRWKPGEASPADALKPWSFSGGISSDPRDDFTYAWDGASPPPMYPDVTLQGRTFLTPQATDTLGARIEQTLAHHADQPDVARDLWAFTAALDFLANADVLSQSLGGFNAALLQLRQQVMSAPGAGDPVWRWLSLPDTPAYQPSIVPIPDAPALQFNPIRAGHFEVEKLWVVDGFGQVFDVVDAMQQGSGPLEPILGTDLVTRDSASIVELKPRLTQPSRLRFEMLSADDDTSVVGIDADADPICGWLIANRLDRSLLVYAGDGVPCGEVFAAKDAARWFPSPTRTPPPSDGAPKVRIDNPHLQAMVEGIVLAADSKAALEGLLALIDESSFAVDAASAWNDQVLPALVGAPIAVVRARLRLELSGSPASSQRWDDICADDSGGFLDVAMPVQLGSTELLDDGLIGAYLNDDYRRIDSVYRLRRPVPYVGDRRSMVRADGPASLLTLLMAPGLSVHAISGVLAPVAVKLPATLATPRLERMALMFRIGPVITDATGVSLPLPTVRSGGWAWVQYDAGDEPGRVGPVSSAGAIAQLPNALPVAREGWLSLLLHGQATVLTYAMNPAALPVTVDPKAPSVVALELTAYNATGRNVSVSRIVLTLPVGDGPDALTAVPELIQVRVAAGTDWAAISDGRGGIEIVPLLPTQLKAGQTLRVSLTGVQTNTRSGTVEVTVTEATQETRSVTLSLTKVSP